MVAAALGKRAQLQHTAYSPQQLICSEHICQRAASSQPRSQKQWHISRLSAISTLSVLFLSTGPLTLAFFSKKPNFDHRELAFNRFLSF
jgi:hypothetical protein